MEANDIEITVNHNEAARSFETQVNGQTALLTYQRHDDKIVLTHTEVPPALEGRGIAGRLAQSALDYARAERLRVTPQCPFVASYINKHPDYQELVAP